MSSIESKLFFTGALDPLKPDFPGRFQTWTPLEISRISAKKDKAAEDTLAAVFVTKNLFSLVLDVIKRFSFKFYIGIGGEKFF